MVDVRALQERCDRPFLHEKYQGFSCNLMPLWRIKQLHANLVETRLGVTGVLPNEIKEIFFQILKRKKFLIFKRKSFF